MIAAFITIGIVVAVCVVGYGVLNLMAESMSDAPSEGSSGLFILIAGIMILATLIGAAIHWS